MKRKRERERGAEWKINDQIKTEFEFRQSTKKIAIAGMCVRSQMSSETEMPAIWRSRHANGFATFCLHKTWIRMCYVVGPHSTCNPIAFRWNYLNFSLFMFNQVCGDARGACYTYFWSRVNVTKSKRWYATSREWRFKMNEICVCDEVKIPRMHCSCRIPPFHILSNCVHIWNGFETKVRFIGQGQSFQRRKITWK